MLPRILAMHLPDGFLSLPVGLVGWFLTIILIVVASRQTRQQLAERQIPLMGILAAFTFAAQMINFPVTGGTSGHLLGGTLIAILLGPWAAVLVMTSVIAVQALLFQDGGLISMGFNIFNMGILSSFIGYAVYKILKSSMVGAFAGAWAGVVVAAVATALELAASGTTSLKVALPAMASVHVLIGIGEALITVNVLAFIRQTRPDLMENKPAAAGAGWLAAGMMIALLITLAAPLASSHPDGLERVAIDKGFFAEQIEPLYEILPDYTIPGIDNEALTTILAGIIGVLSVAGIGYAVGRANKHQVSHKNELG